MAVTTILDKNNLTYEKLASAHTSPTPFTLPGLQAFLKNPATSLCDLITPESSMPKHPAPH